MMIHDVTSDIQRCRQQDQWERKKFCRIQSPTTSSLVIGLRPCPFRPLTSLFFPKRYSVLRKSEFLSRFLSRLKLNTICFCLESYHELGHDCTVLMTVFTINDDPKGIETPSYSVLGRAAHLHQTSVRRNQNKIPASTVLVERNDNDGFPSKGHVLDQLARLA
jgi:hypothetical protein